MNKRVIILEDDPTLLEVMELILTDAGYDVVPIHHYKPLEYLIELMPEVILLDVRLGDGYGHILCKDLKANPVITTIPVVLVSGSPNLSKVAKDCNADSYLTKPFSVEQLLNAVKVYD